MKAIKIFMDAVRETPRLYFAPIQGMFEAAARAQRTMSGRRGVIIRARTVDSKTMGTTGKKPSAKKVKR